MVATATAAEAPAMHSRARRMLPPLATVAGLGAAAVALHVRDPHVQGSWGFCPSSLLFGVYCPGCGGLRAVNDLTNLDVGAAASSNLLFVLALPFLAWVFLRGTVAAWRGEAYAPRGVGTRAFFVFFVALLVAFMVARNLPAGGWLAP